MWRRETSFVTPFLTLASLPPPPPASKFGGGKTSSLIPTKPTIVVCHNHVTDYTDFETIVAHELIHAIDQCRVKNVDFGNINHHACTEVRASNLSGECKYFTEVGRGVFQSRNGQQVSREQELREQPRERARGTRCM